ncbi:MAG: DUF192 domain-containing protein [Pseudomonadota bacterium]
MNYLIKSPVVAALSLLAVVASNAQEPLTIKSGETEHSFTVEVVAEEEDIAQGLMERESLDANAGMLFDFAGSSTSVDMWMKDTPLSLDMLFINDDGKVLAIARNTTPNSERRIGTGMPVRAVLELNGGRARELEIEPGSTISHRLFEDTE